MGDDKGDSAALDLLGEVVDWLGAPDWNGPQLPHDLAKRIASALPENGSCMESTDG